MTPADCYCFAAEAKLDEDDFSTAVELARIGLRKAEDHPGLLQAYGIASYYLGQISESLDNLERASVFAPLAPRSQLILADVYLRLGKRKNAAVGLSFLTEPGRCPTPLLADLARLLGKLGAYRSAFKVCRRLTQLRSWYHPAYYGMAYYLAKLKRPVEQVLRHLQAAHELAPQAIPYRIALSGVLAKLGRLEEAYTIIRDVQPDAVRCTKCLKRLQSVALGAGDKELTRRLRDRLYEIESSSKQSPDHDCSGL